MLPPIIIRHGDIRLHPAAASFPYELVTYYSPTTEYSIFFPVKGQERPKPASVGNLACIWGMVEYGAPPTKMEDCPLSCCQWLAKLGPPPSNIAAQVCHPQKFEGSFTTASVVVWESMRKCAMKHISTLSATEHGQCGTQNYPGRLLDELQLPTARLVTVSKMMAVDAKPPPNWAACTCELHGKDIFIFILMHMRLQWKIL